MLVKSWVKRQLEMEGDQFGPKVTTTTTERLCKGVRLWGMGFGPRGVPCPEAALTQTAPVADPAPGQWLTSDPSRLSGHGRMGTGLQSSPQIDRPMQADVGKWGEMKRSLDLQVFGI